MFRTLTTVPRLLPTCISLTGAAWPWRRPRRTVQRTEAQAPSGCACQEGLPTSRRVILRGPQEQEAQVWGCLGLPAPEGEQNYPEVVKFCLPFKTLSLPNNGNSRCGLIAPTLRRAALSTTSASGPHPHATCKPRRPGTALAEGVAGGGIHCSLLFPPGRNPLPTHPSQLGQGFRSIHRAPTPSQPRQNLSGHCWMSFCVAVTHALGSHGQVPPSQAQEFIGLLLCVQDHSRCWGAERAVRDGPCRLKLVIPAGGEQVRTVAILSGRTQGLLQEDFREEGAGS